jgi:hypothetical protein
LGIPKRTSGSKTESVTRFFRLYNIKNEPGQTQNLAGKYTERVEQITRNMLMLQKEIIGEGSNWFKN